MTNGKGIQQASDAASAGHVHLEWLRQHAAKGLGRLWWPARREVCSRVGWRIAVGVVLVVIRVAGVVPVNICLSGA